MKKQAGFTLVELVVVIAVLGILAATALPRFVNVQSNARVASMNGLAASVRSAASMARAAWVAAGSSGSTVSMDGNNNVTVTTTGTTPGYPTAATGGIEAALQTLDTANFAVTHGATSTFKAANNASCSFTYDPGTGMVNTASLIPANCQ